MQITKSTLIYFSPTGTTKTTVTAIGTGIGLPYKHLDLTLPKHRLNPITLEPSELLIIGFPVYAGRLPEMYAHIFDLLPNGNNWVVPVVVYGNREYDDALLELADLCQAKGYKVVGAASFIGQHSFEPTLATGRPNLQDQELAQQFGTNLLQALKNDKTFNINTIPGKRPYKEILNSLRSIPTPTGNSELCTQCMICVEHCPMGAIDSANPLLTNNQLCAMCMACVYQCPVKARSVNSPLLKAHMAEIAKNNADPKQPTLFLPI